MPEHVLNLCLLAEAWPGAGVPGRDWTLRDWTLRDWTLRDWTLPAGHVRSGPEKKFQNG